MSKIYDAIPHNGLLVKGEIHTKESLRKLSISDIAFVDDKLHQVVAFDEKNNPLFADSETIYEIIEAGTYPPRADGVALFSKSHSEPNELKIVASDKDINSTPLETIWKVKCNDFKQDK